MGARGLGHVYRRGKLWWIKYSVGGVRQHESSRSETKSEAVDLLKRRLQEAGQRRNTREVEKTTFSDLEGLLVNDYRVNGRKSLDTAKRSAKHLRKRLGHFRAIDITTARVRGYIAERQEDGAKPATIRKEVAALGRMMTLAVEDGLLPVRPKLPSIRVENVRTDFFQEHEFRAVAGQLPGPLRPLVQFLYLTGYRVSEAQNLVWSQVDLDAGQLHLKVGTTKNSEGRVLAFRALPELAELLNRQRAETSALEQAEGMIVPWVFHRNGARIHNFHEAWRNACRRAGLPGKLVHSLRRSAARNMIRAGIPERVVMALCGWKTRSMLDRYNIVDTTDQEEGLKKLAEKRRGLHLGDSLEAGLTDTGAPNVAKSL
jgi:integrase